MQCKKESNYRNTHTKKALTCIPLVKQGKDQVEKDEKKAAKGDNDTNQVMSDTSKSQQQSTFVHASD